MSAFAHPVVIERLLEEQALGEAPELTPMIFDVACAIRTGREGVVRRLLEFESSFLESEPRWRRKLLLTLLEEVFREEKEIVEEANNSPYSVRRLEEDINSAMQSQQNPT